MAEAPIFKYYIISPMNTDIHGESPALSFGVRDYGPYHVLNCYRGDTFKLIRASLCSGGGDFQSICFLCIHSDCLLEFAD